MQFLLVIPAEEGKVRADPSTQQARERGVADYGTMSDSSTEEKEDTEEETEEETEKEQEETPS